MMRLCVISFYVVTFYCVDVVKDLGLDQHRTFSYVLSYHINRGTQKANQRYLLFKSFHSRNRELLIIKAVKCYVQPLLVVNSQVWSPHLLKDIRQQEAVQRRFTKKLVGLQALPDSERLRLTGLEQLEARRIFLLI